MSESSEKLSKSISHNQEFTQKCPGYDRQHPELFISAYSGWLFRTSDELNVISKGIKPVQARGEFIRTVENNEELKDYLALFSIMPENLAKYREKGCTKQQWDDLSWTCQVWLNEQRTLVTNVKKEKYIRERLGHDRRQDLKREVAQTVKMGDPYKEMLELKTDCIEALGLKLNPESTSLDDLLETIEKQIKETDLKIDNLSRRIKQDQTYVEHHPDESIQQALDHWQCRKKLAVEKSRKNMLESVKINLDFNSNRISPNDSEAEVARQTKEKLSRAEKKLEDHISAVRSGKEVLDKEMTGERASIRNEVERLYAGLMPLLDKKAELQQNINIVEDFKRSKEQFREELLKQKRPAVIQKLKEEIARLQPKAILLESQGSPETWQMQIREIDRRKDDLNLKILNLSAKLKAMKEVYAEEIHDERAFEEKARRELEMLKTLPRVQKAINCYCSAYKSSFPFFLYVGNLIAGKGKKLSSCKDFLEGRETLIDIVTFAAELPLKGAGINDLEKCLPYDTGSMLVAFHLGLSFGFKVKGTDASVGVALEYKGGIQVGDYRDFSAISEFKLVGVGTVQVPKIIDITLKAELAKWKGGFVFQDQYHWAAWLAARWGHFYAKARACDIYLSERHLGSDYRPDENARAEIEELAKEYLNKNKDIQDIWQQISAYMQLNVLRTEALEFFKGGSLDFNVLTAKCGPGSASDPGPGLGGGLSLAKGTTKLFVNKNEGGRLVEYTGQYETWEAGIYWTCFGYTFRVDYFYCDNDPRQLNNGVVLNVSITPVPKTALWTRLATEILKALDPKDGKSIRQKAEEFISSISKGFITEALKRIPGSLADILMPFEKTKTLQIGLGVSEGHRIPAIWYYRTSMDFALNLATSIPLYYGIYIDAGASLTYNRTFTETLSWNTTGYVLYLYTGLRNRIEMDGPIVRKGSTLRPNELAGRELWKAYVAAHKDQLWHLFHTIGTGVSTGLTSGNLPLDELKVAKAKDAALQFIQQCRNESKKHATYILDPFLDVALGFATGMIPSTYGQVIAAAAKQGMKVKNEFVFKKVEESYNAILPSFQSWLEAEYDKLMEEEQSAYKKFMPVSKSESVFVSQDGDLSKHMGWSAILAHEASKGDEWSLKKSEARQLQRQTGKDMKVCLKCLGDVGNDFEEAVYRLSVAELPQEYWVKDEEVSSCPACGKSLSAGMFTSGKHHCRICGGVFCGDCCSSFKVPEWIDKKQIRVCKACRSIIATPSFRKMVSERKAPKPKAQRDFKPIPQQAAKPSVQQPPKPPLQQKPAAARPVKNEPPVREAIKPDVSAKQVFHDLQPDNFGYVLTAGHQKLLQQHNRREIRIYPDGNCLFSSLITQGVFKEPPSSTPKVREFRNHLSTLLHQGKLKIDDLSPTDSVETIAREIAVSGHYTGDAGELAPELISRALGIKLLIYNADGSTTPVGPEEQNWPIYHLIRFTTCIQRGQIEKKLHYHAAVPQ
ncbi:MAG: FYVE zinc finger domain-containing protein [Syntrophaceae bacterium]|nr:FYVE zinc finger domain-containing protein [Syntrophaceae bacterium]